MKYFVDDEDVESIKNFWSSLPEKLAIVLAESAPRLCEPWTNRVDESLSVRFTTNGYAAVIRKLEDGTFDACVGGVPGFRGVFNTMELAQEACDDALRKFGRLLK